jgi:hypothetical protein
MSDMLTMLGRWQLDVKAVRERMYGAATPRERERWHAVWLLARWSGTPIRLALGWKPYGKQGRRHWLSSRRGAPPRP